jgi:hypothetical protein
MAVDKNKPATAPSNFSSDFRTRSPSPFLLDNTK